jgi:hypothetical protein
MPRRTNVSALGLGLCLGLVACTATGAPTTSPSPSASPEGSAGVVSGLPPGCEPISLQGPDGERFALDGVWLEQIDPSLTPMTWWIYTAGDCAWGAGTVEDPSPEGPLGGLPGDVQSFRGRIGSDFVITGEILWLAPRPPAFGPGNPQRYSPLRMLIQFDDGGEVVLREDREPGVSTPRCPDQIFCPEPLVLRQISGP